MIIVNALLFYFIVAVVNGVHIYNGNLVSRVLGALAFGLIISLFTFLIGQALLYLSHSLFNNVSLEKRAFRHPSS